MLTSLPDLLIIGGAALLIFGPKRLPELAKSLGKGIREFKKAVDGDGNESQANPSNEAQVLPPAHQGVPQAPTQQAQAQPVPNGSSTDHHNG